MCDFKSFIVTKSGKVLFSDEDSHEAIIRKFADKYDLRDETTDPERLLFARVEITPPNGDVFEKDINNWNFVIDQSIIPTWWSDDNKRECLATLEKYLSEVIIDEQEIDVIEDKSGLYIRNSKIGKIINANVDRIGGSAKVDYIGGSAKVDYIGGSAKVDYICDSAIVARISDSANVARISDSAKVEYIGDSAIVDYIGDYAKVEYIGDYAKVEYIGDSAIVARISDSANVDRIGGSATATVYSPSVKYSLGDNAVAIERYTGTPIIKVANPEIVLEIIKEVK